MIVPQETLLAKVWGPEYRDATSCFRLYITYFAKKIGAGSANPRNLTERGWANQFVIIRRAAGKDTRFCGRARRRQAHPRFRPVRTEDRVCVCVIVFHKSDTP